jgi:hypothetical protein
MIGGRGGVGRVEEVGYRFGAAPGPSRDLDGKARHGMEDIRQK